MRIAVTGASGQLGSYLLDEIGSRHDPLGIDLAPTQFTAHEAHIQRADVRDFEAMRRLLKGTEVIIHCAAQVSVENSIRDPFTDLSINVLGTLTLLDAAADLGVGKFIYISSAAVYGDPVHLPVTEEHPTSPKSPYGASKASAEHYVRVFGETRKLPFVVVRPFNFYSPRVDPKSPYSGVMTKFVERAKRSEPLLVEGDGEQTRDFIHALDVARFIVALTGSKVQGTTMNIGSGKSTSINQLARTVVKVCGKEVEIKHVAPRVGDIRNSVSDISRARKLLSFEPQITLEEGLKTFFK